MNGSSVEVFRAKLAGFVQLVLISDPRITIHCVCENANQTVRTRSLTGICAFAEKYIHKGIP